MQKSNLFTNIIVTSVGAIAGESRWPGFAGLSFARSAADPATGQRFFAIMVSHKLRDRLFKVNRVQLTENKEWGGKATPREHAGPPVFEAEQL